MAVRRCTSWGAFAVSVGGLAAIMPSALALQPSLASASTTCQNAQATGSRSYRWPVANPALVAPVKLQFDYPIYSNPLEAEFTGEVLALPTPVEYLGGFSIITSSGTGSNSTEQYVLRRIELRKPGKVPEGIGQVLPHVMEVALVHEQVGGPHWANVIVPFTVSAESTYDMLFPLVFGATMPMDMGQREPMLLSGAQELNLNAGFGNCTFHHQWTTLPTDCIGKTVTARQFMRSKTLNIGFETYNLLMTTLANAPDFPPLQSAPITWIIDTCPAGGTCTVSEIPNLVTLLSEARTLQSQAVAELRERKALMDQAYNNLINGTGDAAELYKIAVSARADLATAHSEMQSVAHYTSELEGWSNQSQGANWDADAPQVTPAPAAAAVASTTAVPSATGAGASLLSQASTPSDCSALQLSPVDIDMAQVVDPGTISPELREPLAFMWDRTLPDAPLRVAVQQGRLRARAAPDSHSSPLGAIVVGGRERKISYAELRVPGEHAVNGQAGVAELQLVHSPPSGAAWPAVALSLRFQVGRQDNPWVEALLQRGRFFSASEVDVQGAQVGEVHALLAQGSMERYFRYDGTLTSPPCVSTQWFVVEEPGVLTQRQLTALFQLLTPAAPPAPKKGGASAFLVTAAGALGQEVPVRRFRATLVAFGTPRLVSKVSAAGLDADALSPARVRLRRKRIAI